MTGPKLYLVNGMVVRSVKESYIFDGSDIPAVTMELNESDRRKLWVSPQHVVAWSRN